MTIDLSLGLGYLPIVWSILTFAAFVTSYAVSVSNGHVYPFLPAISDTGSKSPEANVFSLFMNLSIIVSIGNFFVRYSQCQLQAKHCRDNRDGILRLNKLAVVLAVVSGFGALIVANVQSRKQNYMVEIHDTGAVLIFGFGALYFWVQTFMSYKMRQHGIYSSRLCHLRLALTTVVTLCAVVFFTAAAYGWMLFQQDNHHHMVNNWMPGDGGYSLHVLSNSAEWLALIASLCLSLTFFGEFQQAYLFVECREKTPTIISAYDGLSEYSTLKMNSDDRYVSDDECNNNEQ